MRIKTGQTIYENINFSGISASFNTKIIKDGIIDTGVTVQHHNIIAGSSLYSFAWSASTYGDYQLYIGQSEGMTEPYLSGHFYVVPDDEVTCSVFVGI